MNDKTPSLCSETKISPMEITLEDCLACSGCEDAANSLFATKIPNPKNINFVFTPQSKINLMGYFKSSKMADLPIFRLFQRFSTNLENFEKFLYEFFSFLGSDYVLDTSYFRKTHLELVCKEYIGRSGDLLITSDCPGVVSYVEKKFPNFVQNLSKVQTINKMAEIFLEENSKKKSCFVFPCLDKKLENKNGDGNFFITTREFIQFLESVDPIELENFEFIDNIDTPIYSKVQMSIGSSTGGYCEYLLKSTGENFSVTTKNNFYEIYSVKSEKFLKIRGLKNVINFLNRNKIRKESNFTFIEAFICTECISGPAQIEYKENQLEIYKKREFLEGILINNLKFGAEREFQSNNQKILEFNVDW